MFVYKFVITAIAAMVIAFRPEATQVKVTNSTNARDTVAKKELYLPAKVNKVPDNNDYTNCESEYCFKRMVESDDIAIFWHKEFGDDPTTNVNEKKTFQSKGCHCRDGAVLQVLCQ